MKTYVERGELRTYAGDMPETEERTLIDLKPLANHIKNEVAPRNVVDGQLAESLAIFALREVQKNTTAYLEDNFGQR